MDAGITIADKTNIDSGALDQSTLEGGSGIVISLKDSGITANKFIDSSVTTAKILNANVTTAKIADGAVTTAKIADLNVTTAKILNANVTKAKLASVGEQISSDSGTFTPTTSYTTMTNCSVTITTNGNPVMVIFGHSSANSSGSGVQLTSGADSLIKLVRTESGTPTVKFYQQFYNNNAGTMVYPCNIVFMDSPAAGTYTYSIEGISSTGGATYQYLKLTAYEL